MPRRPGESKNQEVDRARAAGKCGWEYPVPKIKIGREGNVVLAWLVIGDALKRASSAAVLGRHLRSRAGSARPRGRAQLRGQELERDGTLVPEIGELSLEGGGTRTHDLRDQEVVFKGPHQTTNSSISQIRYRGTDVARTCSP